jgi:protein ImuB
MLWCALLLPTDSSNPSRIECSIQALSIWALQFTPRVALARDGVLMEVEGSTRLFRGRRALRDRVVNGSAEMGVAQVAWAPTSLAAQALARAGREDGIRRPLQAVLDALSMGTLDAVMPHALTLSHIGCRTLGDVRRLPRGGVSRRFDAALLRALDQAYGLQAEVHEWVTLPERFRATLELPSRVDQAPAMMQGARYLMLQMCGWLTARHMGVTRFTLGWAHDAMRSRQVGQGGELSVHTAEPTQQAEHLCRLLAEHLAHVQLMAPVGDLCLSVDEAQSLPKGSLPLLQDSVQAREPLPQVLERLAARLGTDHVLRPVLCEDHRQEWMCHWQAADQPFTPRKPLTASQWPQPTFVLPEPLRLAMHAERPCYLGPLMLLMGPQRIEAGWWHRDEAAGLTHEVARDYWVAWSEQAGLLWVFQTRLGDAPAWYLHGHFA